MTDVFISTVRFDLSEACEWIISTINDADIEWDSEKSSLPITEKEFDVLIQNNPETYNTAAEYFWKRGVCHPYELRGAVVEGKINRIDLLLAITPKGLVKLEEY